MAVNLLLALATGGLAVGALKAAQTPLVPPTPTKQASTEQSEPLRVRFLPPAAHSFDVLAKRPPFQADRRPAARIGKQTPAVRAALPPAVKVTGLMAVGPSRRALISVSGAPPALVAVGETIAGWRLAEISQTAITLRKGDRTHSVQIGDEPPASPAPTSSASPATAPQSSARGKGTPSGPVDMSETIDE